MSLPPFSGSEQNIQRPPSNYFTVFYDNYSICVGKTLGRDYYYTLKHNLYNRLYQSEIYHEKIRFDDKNIFLNNTGSLGFNTGKVYNKFRKSRKWLEFIEYPRELYNKNKHRECIMSQLMSSFIKVDEEQKNTSRDYSICLSSTVDD